MAPIPISSSTMGSRPRLMTRTAESSRPGALPCVRVIWVASRSTPAAAVVAAPVQVVAALVDLPRRQVADAVVLLVRVLLVRVLLLAVLLEL